MAPPREGRIHVGVRKGLAWGDEGHADVGRRGVHPGVAGGIAEALGEEDGSTRAARKEAATVGEVAHAPVDGSIHVGAHKELAWAGDEGPGQEDGRIHARDRMAVAVVGAVCQG